MGKIIYKEESYKIIGICMDIHRELGHGFLEIVYNPKLVSALTPEMNEVINEAKAKIISGEIKVELK